MHLKMKKYIAITAGEPAGIGVDICLSLAEKSTQQTLNLPENIGLVLLADKNLLQQRLALLNAHRNENNKLNFADLENFVKIQHIPLYENVYTPKILHKQNSAYVLDLLNFACDCCLNGDFAAMVTAPLHKGIINDYLRSQNDLHLFKGHTEYLANRCKIADDDVVMMLAGEQKSGEMLRVALLTTHLPLKAVAAEVSEKNLTHKLSILHRELQQKYKLKSPKIAVCGLNPHAGDNGYLGDEELKIINPTLQKLRNQGLNLLGAFPADTLFTPPNLRGLDAVFAMYHDQGLAPLKYATFGNGINITLGLPIIRTSVDHGTALEIAGEGLANNGSLVAAIKEAVKMVD